MAKTPFAFLALVFALGAQTMIVELSLPRLLAPAFGNTLFCWTAAISEVLAALAIGYHVGGVLSSRRARSTATLWWLAALSSAGVALTGIWGDSVINSLSGFGMIAGPLFGTLFLAVPPAFLGATVLPVCVGMTSTEKDSGKSAGRLYAFSTLGSVIGVLITGYVLLPFLGVSGSFFSAAAFVFATFFPARKYLWGVSGLGAVLLCAFFATSGHADHVLFDKSNGYHRIKVMSSKEDPRIRLLFLDSTLEGAMLLGSTNPGMAYHRSGALIANVVPELRRCLFLGGGTFSIPKFVKSKYPNVEVDVAEIDPDVVKVAEEYFELPEDLNVLIGDARRILNDNPTKYDLIVNDAFRGVRKIPFHLVTQEFHTLVSEKLSPEGVYAVNVMGHPIKSRLVASVTRSLQESFQHVHHYRFTDKDIQNVWILSSNQPIPLGSEVSHQENGLILTDNHAPVEFLIALDLTGEVAQ
jgi:spermidine synthase